MREMSELEKIEYKMQYEFVMNLGFIWRWNKLDFLTREEAEYWNWHTLPFGWRILKYPPEPLEVENETDKIT